MLNYQRVVSVIFPIVPPHVPNCPTVQRPFQVAQISAAQDRHDRRDGPKAPVPQALGAAVL